MFLCVYKLVRFFHINEYVLIKQENPIYITLPSLLATATLLSHPPALVPWAQALIDP
jgi:hypothetical protein